MSFPNHQSGAYGVVPYSPPHLMPGASNYRLSAILQRAEQDSMQNNINKVGGKIRRKITRRNKTTGRKTTGGDGSNLRIAVPSFDVHGGDNGLNIASQNVNFTHAQSNANGKFDACFDPSAPGCGGNQTGGDGSDSELILNRQSCGCVSGVRRRRTNRKRTKKSKKSSKRKKSKQTKKSEKIKKSRKTNKSNK